MRTLLVAAALTTGALLSAGVAQAADSTVVVNAASLSGGHWSTLDSTASGTGAFKFGPATTPLGTGSYELTTPDAPAKVRLGTDLSNGTPLTSITGIGYSTYRVAPPVGGAPVASLNLVAILPGVSTFATLVYEPYQQVGGNALINNGVWQSWDAFAGRWWSTKIPSCLQATPCPWSQIVSMYPTATVYNSVPGYPSFAVNQGSSNAGTDSYADALYLQTAAGRTTYDFEGTDTTPPSCGTMVVHRGAQDSADVTVSDSVSGIASITNFTVSNGSASIPAFTPGASSVTVTAIKTIQGVNTHFEFDVTDVAGNTTHCV
jgi:hypothetical protein